MKLEWSAREQPLAAEGCWVEGAAAQKLRAKLLAGNRPGLRIVQTGARLVVLGADLPWVDGIIYLGRQAEGANLYLPTLWQPNLPPPWLAARLQHLGQPPWALVPPNEAIGLSAAAVIS